MHKSHQIFHQHTPKNEFVLDSSFQNIFSHSFIEMNRMQNAPHASTFGLFLLFYYDFVHRTDEITRRKIESDVYMSMVCVQHRTNHQAYKAFVVLSHFLFSIGYGQIVFYVSEK